MADTKISLLTAGGYADGSEEIAAAAAGANEKFTVSQLIGGAFVVLQSAYTLTSTTASQRLFDASTNGALTLPTGLYVFDTMLLLSSMSATSGNGAFSILGAGTAVIARPLLQTIGFDNTSTSANAALNGAMYQAAVTGSNIHTAAAGTGLQTGIRGVFDVTTAGTVIPSIALTSAAAAIVGVGSYFRVQRIGPTATATLGNWS